MGRNRAHLLKAKEKRMAQGERRQTKVACLEESNEALKIQVLDLQQQLALLTEQLQASQAAAQKQAEDSSLVIGSLRDRVHALQADKAKHIKAAQARRSKAAAKRAAERDKKNATQSLAHPLTQSADFDFRTYLLAEQVASSVLEEGAGDLLITSNDSSLVLMFSSMKVTDDSKSTASGTTEKPKTKAKTRRGYYQNRK